MNHKQNSRRSFISSVAILSAGAAFGSANDLFSAEKSKTDIQQQWRFFYKQNGGNPFYMNLQFQTEPIVRSCKGHIHKTGTPVYFSNENILAQPTWIYWGREKSRPDDVLISFFDNNQKKKIFTINRFELESMQALTSHKEPSNPLRALKETSPCRSNLERQDNNLKIMTKIRKGKDVWTVVKYLKKEITIENKLIYNI
jgi:hypothetical protein